MIVLLFGAPGSGKGTQSRFISERRKIPAISTGDMLRAECRSETALGLAAKSILANGGLVDDELVNAMVVKRLTRSECRSGFILDGYPRTVPQAVFLSEFIRQQGLPEPKVIHLDVPIPVLVLRLILATALPFLRPHLQPALPAACARWQLRRRWATPYPKKRRCRRCRAAAPRRLPHAVRPFDRILPGAGLSP